MAWVLTAGLQNLRSQVNERFPNRDHASDGTIGDTAHQAETSGHNPDDTSGSSPEWNGDPDSTAEVRAWDMDDDLGESGASAQKVVDHIRALPNVSSVLRYIIYNRKIYSASSGWTTQTYTGPSAHTEHIHFSGAFSQAADNNTSFDYRLDDINMPSLQDILNGISDDLADDTSGIARNLDNRTVKALNKAIPYVGNQGARIKALGFADQSVVGLLDYLFELIAQPPVNMGGAQVQGGILARVTRVEDGHAVVSAQLTALALKLDQIAAALVPPAQP